ncbi:MAG TPA: adenosine monophosphate-protein transferase [Methanosarcinales archaeon]|nr:adenosine monophosphate-protein transferase [Methanosarcinales archaeon]
MELETIKIETPKDSNFILGHTHFIKSVEDLYEAIVSTVPNSKFGIAFCEASQQCLIRVEGNDEELKNAAIKNAEAIGSGHSFIIFIRDAFPINILNAIKNVQEVCRIFCATANPVEVIIAKTEQGRGILGVIDGFSPLGVEREKEIQERKEFLRKIGYKR